MRKARHRRFVKHRKEEKNPFFIGRENLSSESPTKGGFFQAKLEISDPSEPTEKEADKVANQVVNHAKTSAQKSAFGKNSVQRQEKEEEPSAKRIQRQAEKKEEEPAAKRIQRQAEEEEEEVQAKHIQRQAEEEEEPATKRIQRQAEEKEEKPAAMRIQRQAEKEEEEPAAKRIQRQVEEEEEVQAKHIQRQAEEEEEPAAKRIQRQAEEEEEEVQAKRIQRQAEEEEEAVQAKNIQTHSGNHPVSLNTIQPKSKKGDSKEILESMIQETKGMGMALPNDILKEMEGEFKTDFSKVRIHIGEKAVKMTSLIQALAFTHGYDIYFNAGKYQPYSSAGKMLLAHELTHVVQQKG